MDIEALASLESQKRFCADLVQQVVDHESFVLLAGERGSGRTVVCEQVVNETDSKMRAVFIPCHKDMQLQRLRELFLQQLLPNMEFDTSINLPDALIKVHIPHNNRILVVVDDVDVVVSAFYNELLALYEQFLGQSRFSFILVCKPLWAEEKISRYNGKAEITLKQIPPLNLQESIILSRHIFALNNTLRIYKAIANRLPEALAGTKGNLSRIIADTETLMKEPTAPQLGQDTGGKGKLPAAAKGKKKSNTVGIFVTVVCIIIVLACLIPIFFGGNFFSDEDANTTQAQVPNENALLFDEGNKSFADSVTADTGALPPSVSGDGLEARAPARQTEHSVTLSGEELDRIEGGANGSGYPRGVGGPQVNNAAPVNQVATLRREDNRNHFREGSAPQTTAVDVTAQQQQALMVQQQQAAAAAALEHQKQLQEQQRQQQLAAQQAAQQAAAQQAAQQQQQPQQPELLEAPKPPRVAANAHERDQLDQAAQDKLAADRERAQQAARQQEQERAQQPQQTAQNNRQQQQQNAQRQQQPAQPQRPPLRAGQVINLADEQRAQQSARQPQRPAAPANNTAQRATGRAVEGNIREMLNMSDDRFTVQIVSSSSRANITAAAQGLNGRYWILETRYNNRPWFVLLSGDYATRDAAQAAARQIPRSVSQGAIPFAKRLMDIKPEIR